MDDSPKDITITFIINLVVSLGSTYLFSLKLINLTSFITIIAGGIVFIIITGFQSKLNKIDEKSKKQDQRIMKLEEKLKIYEKLINIDARLIALERGNKNGKK